MKWKGGLWPLLHQWCLCSLRDGLLEKLIKKAKTLKSSQFYLLLPWLYSRSLFFELSLQWIAMHFSCCRSQKKTRKRVRYVILCDNINELHSGLLWYRILKKLTLRLRSSCCKPRCDTSNTLLLKVFCWFYPVSQAFTITTNGELCLFKFLEWRTLRRSRDGCGVAPARRLGS